MNKNECKIVQDLLVNYVDDLLSKETNIYIEEHLENRTFGVVVDTSGSMSTRQIGLALGAIASYATSKDVPFVRVVFCDADAYDAGYMSPDDIAGRVEVTGRGGTVLQPAVNLLLKEKDFPTDAPILITGFFFVTAM